MYQLVINPRPGTYQKKGRMCEIEQFCRFSRIFFEMKSQGLCLQVRYTFLFHDGENPTIEFPLRGI
jgi:hypothetical protein